MENNYGLATSSSFGAYSEPSAFVFAKLWHAPRDPNDAPKPLVPRVSALRTERLLCEEGSGFIQAFNELTLMSAQQGFFLRGG
jgi:hypothetical protein